MEGRPNPEKHDALEGNVRKYYGKAEEFRSAQDFMMGHSNSDPSLIGSQSQEFVLRRSESKPRRTVQHITGAICPRLAFDKLHTREF
jgi:hypothetical protein